MNGFDFGLFEQAIMAMSASNIELTRLMLNIAQETLLLNKTVLEANQQNNNILANILAEIQEIKKGL